MNNMSKTWIISPSRGEKKKVETTTYCINMYIYIYIHTLLRLYIVYIFYIPQRKHLSSHKAMSNYEFVVYLPGFRITSRKETCLGQREKNAPLWKNGQKKKT